MPSVFVAGKDLFIFIERYSNFFQVSSLRYRNKFLLPHSFTAIFFKFIKWDFPGADALAELSRPAKVHFYEIASRRDRTKR